MIEPVALVASVARDLVDGDATHAVAAAGGAVVLWTDASAVPRAAWATCPHRGASLSCADVRDGELTCPIHGWRFDGEGRNTFRPQGRPLGHLGLDMLRVVQDGDRLLVLRSSST